MGFGCWKKKLGVKHWADVEVMPYLGRVKADGLPDVGKGRGAGQVPDGGSPCAESDQAPDLGGFFQAVCNDIGIGGNPHPG